jgi:diguanylate cyclase (GGDEF)-like protein
VQGTITYYQPGSALVLQSGSKSLWIVTQDREDLKIGDVADATGIPDVRDGFLTLTRSEIKDSGVRSPISPLASTWSELAQSHHIFDLVSVQGKVVMEVREAAQDEYVLLADDHMFSAIVRHPSATYSSVTPLALPPMKQVPVGATVRVSGICVLADSNPFDAQVPFNLLMRSVDDIAVIARPSPISVRNLVRVVTVLLVITLAVTAWGWTLRRKVHRQTEALAYQSAIEAARERRNTELQLRRSRILEDINGSRRLVEILADVTRLVSFQLSGPPCWCEIADVRMGDYPPNAKQLKILSEEIPSRSGPPLGTLFAGFFVPVQPDGKEHEILVLGTQLATLAIETRRLYSDLVHRSEFDLLTDIHNRFSMEKQLDALLGSARGQARIFGIIYIDLDHFKQVNDLYGHQVGDLYLQEVSRRMKRQLRPGDTLARLGGDEFAALISTARDRADVEEIALRLERCFVDPFSLDGYVLHGSASIGIALYPEDGATRDSLLNSADASMYVAKFTKRQGVDAPTSPRSSGPYPKARS